MPHLIRITYFLFGFLSVSVFFASIVTASHDRNAFVWNEEQDPNGPGTVWKPSLVILRIDKSALDVKWSVSFSHFLFRGT